MKMTGGVFKASRAGGGGREVRTVSAPMLLLHCGFFFLFSPALILSVNCSTPAANEDTGVDLTSPYGIPSKASVVPQPSEQGAIEALGAALPPLDLPPNMEDYDPEDPIQKALVDTWVKLKRDKELQLAVLQKVEEQKIRDYKRVAALTGGGAGVGLLGMLVSMYGGKKVEKLHLNKGHVARTALKGAQVFSAALLALGLLGALKYGVGIAMAKKDAKKHATRFAEDLKPLERSLQLAILARKNMGEENSADGGDEQDEPSVSRRDG